MIREKKARKKNYTKGLPVRNIWDNISLLSLIHQISLNSRHFFIPDYNVENVYHRATKEAPPQTILR